MPRLTTAKPLTEEQKQLAAGVLRLVNHFVRRNKPPEFSHADFRSEMLLAVVKGASHYDPSRGSSFDTCAHRFMEWRAKSLRYAAYQKSTYRVGGKRLPRTVQVRFVDSGLFEGLHVVRIDGVYFGRLPRRIMRQHHL
jgi:hypothetical protein